MKVLLYYIGKARDTHANAMAEEYIKRSTRFAKCEMREIHPLRFDPWAKHPSAAKILLDPAGRALDSAGFISLVEKAERDGRDMVFVIGGADGLPAGVEAARGSAAGAVADDHAARTGARGAGGADLSRAYRAARAPLPTLAVSARAGYWGRAADAALIWFLTGAAGLGVTLAAVAMVVPGK